MRADPIRRVPHLQVVRAADCWCRDTRSRRIVNCPRVHSRRGHRHLMDRLPDQLESNARVEVQIDGETVGTRRAINFVGATGGDDDGTNEVVTVNLSGEGEASGPTYPNSWYAAFMADRVNLTEAMLPYRFAWSEDDSA